MTCPFCKYGPGVHARRDQYPVSDGHTLVVPGRHVASFFDLSADEQADVLRMVSRVRTKLARSHKPDGFNVGVNDGLDAGQTVMHCHVHVIPRYRGDVQDPAGGVRGVIPSRRRYPLPASLTRP